MDGGVYVAVFYLPQSREIVVGWLGRFRFHQGTYLYAGSAQRGLSARLERHSRRDKPLRWHIDYLAREADMLGAIVLPGPREQECRVASSLAGIFARPVKGFGASDCNCDGHLFYAPDWP